MHKKYSYILFLVISFCILLIGADRYAELKIYRNCFKNNGAKRSIALKEYPVGSVIWIDPFPDSICPPFSSYPLQKSKLVTDSNGFIVTSKNSNNPAVKLFFLGGSTTECLHNSEENRFPERTARLLEADLGVRINAYNCGVGGINTIHSLNILLNKVLPQKPDYVFLMHNINDLVTLLYFDSYWTSNNVRSNIEDINYRFKDQLPAVSENPLSHIRYLIFHKNAEQEDQFRGLREKVYRERSDSLEKTELFRKNILTFISICKAQSVVPVLMTQANNFDVLDYDWYERYRNKEFQDFGSNKREFVDYFLRMMNTFNEVIIDVAKQNNCILINLDKEINDVNYFFDEVHYNDKGSVKAAEVIKSSMAEIIRKQQQLKD